MQADPLQQLRDVHAPADPGWWPPAPGWWILALLAMALLAWLFHKLWQAYQLRAPLRAGRKLLGELHSQCKAGSLPPNEYLHEANEVMKRVLVRGYQMEEYAPLAGQAWLQALDKLGNTQAFTDGPSATLGEQRFSRDPHIEVDTLHKNLMNVLSQVPLHSAPTSKVAS